MAAKMVAPALEVSGRLREDQMASALRQLIGDRNVRRYLCLHHPEDLHRALLALDAWDSEHHGQAV